MMPLARIAGGGNPIPYNLRMLQDKGISGVVGESYDMAKTKQGAVWNNKLIQLFIHAEYIGPLYFQYEYNFFLRFTDLTTFEYYDIVFDEEPTASNIPNVFINVVGNVLVIVFCWGGQHPVIAREWTIQSNETITYLGSADLADPADLPDPYAVIDLLDIFAYHGKLLKLKSGALVFVGYRDEADENNDLIVWTAYRKPSTSDGALGTWSYQRFSAQDSTETSGAFTSPFFSLAQHPVDDAVWIFIKRDSHARLSGVKMTDTGTGLTYVTTVVSIVANPADTDDIAPEGEHPPIEAFPCPERNTIILTYLNNEFLFFMPVPVPPGSGDQYFIKGTQTAVIEIDENGTRVSNTATNDGYHIERTTDWGLLFEYPKIYIVMWDMASKCWNARNPLDPTDEFYRVPSYLLTYDISTDTWSTPEYLGVQMCNHWLSLFTHVHAGNDAPCITQDLDVCVINVDAGGEINPNHKGLFILPD